MGGGFSKDTLKVKAKMASGRLQTHISKKEAVVVKIKREIAGLLDAGKDQSARIKVEGVIREEQLCRVYEWLILMTDIIHTRVKQIETSKTCPDDLAETVCSLMYAAKRLDDIRELQEICVQLRLKWGAKWFEANLENRSGRVSKKIIAALDVSPPSRDVVVDCLKEIAIAEGVIWEDDAELDAEAMPGLVGHLNEFTIEFDSKPFGMEWTATADGDNLWVSSITPMSVAERSGVILGAMLVAFNGKDIRGAGASNIHEQAAVLGLPLRITFRKPGDYAGDSKTGGGEDLKVDPGKVNETVTILKDPTNWPLNHEQRLELASTTGCNAAEAAAAVFLAEYLIEQQAAAMMAAATMPMATMPMASMPMAAMPMASAASVSPATGVMPMAMPMGAAVGSGGVMPGAMPYVAPVSGMGYTPAPMDVVPTATGVPTSGYVVPAAAGTSPPVAAFAEGTSGGGRTAEMPAPGSVDAGDELDDLEARFSALKNL